MIIIVWLFFTVGNYCRVGSDQFESCPGYRSNSRLWFHVQKHRRISLRDRRNHRIATSSLKPRVTEQVPRRSMWLSVIWTSWEKRHLRRRRSWSRWEMYRPKWTMILDLNRDWMHWNKFPNMLVVSSHKFPRNIGDLHLGRLYTNLQVISNVFNHKSRGSSRGRLR